MKLSTEQLEKYIENSKDNEIKYLPNCPVCNGNGCIVCHVRSNAGNPCRDRVILLNRRMPSGTCGGVGAGADLHRSVPATRLENK